MGTSITAEKLKYNQVFKTLAVSSELDLTSLGKVCVAIRVESSGKVAALSAEGDDYVAAGTAYTDAVATCGRDVAIPGDYISGTFTKVKTDTTAKVVCYVSNAI